MHRLKMRLILLIAGLIGLVAIVFGLVNTTNNAQATTPDPPGGNWKFIGQITKVKASTGNTVMDVNIPANAKTGALVKNAYVIIKSNPPDPAKDYPQHSFRVIAYKAPLLALELVPPGHCDVVTAPNAVPALNTQNLYTGPCVKRIVPPTGPENHLSGVSDIIVDGGNPAVDAYHCISRTDIDAAGLVLTSAVCFDNTGALGQGAAAEPINSPPGEGTTGDAGGVGPPPPPPYGVAPPAKGRGTYIGDNLITTSCFPDVGKSVNIIATVTVIGAQAQLAATGKTVGTVDIWINQTNANCDALTPVGAPLVAAGGLTIYPAADIPKCPGGDCVQSPYRSGAGLHGYPDWDQDGCTDFDELYWSKPGPHPKCGDDPWNPNDVPAAATPDVSGEYSLTAIALRQDVGAPGFYYDCNANIEQSGKNLQAWILCYIDSPAVVVNPSAVPMPNAGATTCPPAPAAYCGDGISGAPPPGTTVGTYPTSPRLLSKTVLMPKPPIKLTGFVDNIQNVYKLTGCFNPGYIVPLVGNVWVEAWINVHTGHGKVNLWPNLTDADCKAGIHAGPGSIIPVHAVRQNMKVADPYPGPGASTGHDGDGDGCSDKRELKATAANRGGYRDPSNHYDYFNPTQDGLNRVDDILATVNQYFQDDPPGVPDMKSLTDRTAILGANSWNLGPPNGQQRVDDILNSVKQYFHDC
jgi:hypothetical protein